MNDQLDFKELQAHIATNMHNFLQLEEKHENTQIRSLYDQVHKIKIAKLNYLLYLIPLQNDNKQLPLSPKPSYSLSGPKLRSLSPEREH